MSEEKIKLAAAAGLRSAGVSIDGLADVHDRLRGVDGSYSQALQALRHLRTYGLSGSVNTQINAHSLPQLSNLMDVIIAAGATSWQVQLTAAMGNAADRPELLIQPYQIPELMDLLADLFVKGRERGLLLVPGNNIGYFGPYEAMWRSITGRVEFYGGCHAGRTAMGIEADGAIKGCPSLPTQDYVGGNVREKSVAEIWNESTELAFMRDVDASSEALWGYCRTCYYSDVCRGGCNWTTHVLTGRRGNNPLCHYRALKLAERGMRERIVQRKPAPGQPFDFGEYDILVETSDGSIYDQSLFDTMDDGLRKGSYGRTLELCSECSQFLRAGEETCPNCASVPAKHHSEVRSRTLVLSATQSLREAKAQLVELTATLAKKSWGHLE